MTDIHSNFPAKAMLEVWKDERHSNIRFVSVLRLEPWDSK